MCSIRFDQMNTLRGAASPERGKAVVICRGGQGVIAVATVDPIDNSQYREAICRIRKEQK